MSGYIEVLTGSMFSGKTEILVTKLKRVRLAQKHFLAFKPARDVRTERNLETMIAQALGLKDVRHLVFSVSSPDEVKQILEGKNIDAVAFDEAQFFDPWIVDIVKYLAWEKGVIVWVAGLDLDYRRQEFGTGHMSTLMAIADHVEKLRAICFKCGEEARFTQRIKGSQDQVQVGGKGDYEARCGNCFYEFGTEAS